MKLETCYLWAWSFLSNDPFSFCMCFWRLQMSSPILPGRESLWWCLPFFTCYSVQPELTSILRTAFGLSSVSYVEIFIPAVGEMKLSGPLWADLYCHLGSQQPSTASWSSAGNSRALFRARWDPCGRLAMKWILRKTKKWCDELLKIVF